jgi:hypothetical protein
MRKAILLSILLMVCSSCRYLDNSPSKEVLLEQELKSINWKDVDTYPSVAHCDSIEDEPIRRQCFFQFMTNEIQQKLAGDAFSMKAPKLDTINVKVTVLPDSTVQFETQLPKDSATDDTKEFDSILHARLTDFPKINPAIKRGVPVKSQFVLPVILKVE